MGLRFVLQNYLPDAASDTLLESYVLFSIIFFLATGVGIAVVAAVPGASIAAANMWCWLLLGAIWVGGHLYFFWKARRAMESAIQPKRPNSLPRPPFSREEPKWREERLHPLEKDPELLKSAFLESDNARSVISPGLQDQTPYPIEPLHKVYLTKGFVQGNASGGLPHLSGSNRHVPTGTPGAGGASSPVASRRTPHSLRA